MVPWNTRDLHRSVGVKTIYDLSATPYYLKGSGYNEGFIFPGSSATSL